MGLPPAVLRQLGVSTAGTTGRAGENGEKSEEEDAAEDDAAATSTAPTRDDGSARPAEALHEMGSASSVVDVRVSYRRLPRGTYCKLQPKSQDFQVELASEAGVDLRALLETAMTRRCTLGVGDEVVVSAELATGVPGLKSYALRCVEVQPDDAGAPGLGDLGAATLGYALRSTSYSRSGMSGTSSLSTGVKANATISATFLMSFLSGRRTVLRTTLRLLEMASKIVLQA